MKTNVLLAAAAASVSLIIAGCATEPEAPKPAPAPAPAPVTQSPAPAAPAPAAPKTPAMLSVSSTELFEFNKAVLNADAKARLDKEVIARLADMGNIRYIIVNGHADRLGGTPYNQKLSERRADAVRAYLVSKGADASKVETLGFGKTLPVKSCPNQPRAQLIECLAANRRVVVEVQGTPR